MSLEQSFKCLIDGKMVDAPTHIPVINPATEAAIAHAPISNPEMVEDAIKAADAAQADWSARSLSQRQEVVSRIGQIMTEHEEELAHLLTLEQGKPLPDAHFEVSFCAGLFAHYATKAVSARVLCDDDEGYAEQLFKPYGVVSGIVPWNFPLLTAVMKIGPALVTGNAIIIKPAPTTPLATLRLGELCADAVPAGVLQVLSDDNSIGPLLSSHPKIAKVSFTGSTVTGRKIMASAAPTLKRMQLELGGNDAAIVLGDVDPEAVAEAIFSIAFMNCGQVCTAIKRVYVQEAIYDRFCGKLAELADAAVVGNGLEDGVQLGPVQNRMQYDKLLGFLEEAHRKGRVVAGGQALDGPGYFIRPTIVCDLDDSASLVCEEQFGPVLPVLSYADPADAVKRANQNQYGLTASVWSADKAKATEIARQLDAGVTWVNKHLDLNPDYPFSPFKQSGIGFEFGDDGLREFTQAQLLSC